MIGVVQGSLYTNVHAHSSFGLQTSDECTVAYVSTFALASTTRTDRAFSPSGPKVRLRPPFLFREASLRE